MFAGGVEVGEEAGDEGGDEGFELVVEAVLAGIEKAVLLDDPTHVAGLVVADEEAFGAAVGRGSEDILNGLHGAEEAGLVEGGQPAEHVANVGCGAFFQGRKGLAAFGREGEEVAAGVRRGGGAAEEFPAFE